VEATNKHNLTLRISTQHYIIISQNTYIQTHRYGGMMTAFNVDLS